MQCDLSSSWAASDSRRMYRVQWYDALGRPTTSADYGTNGDAALSDYDPATGGTQGYGDTPPGPNSHDDVIVAKVEYDGRGNAYQSTDNKGIITQRQFDDLRRMTKLIENYVDGQVGESETDSDRTTEYVFDSAGRLAELRAYNPKGSGNGVETQSTRYLYTSTVNASWVTGEICPESSDTDETGTDQVKFTFDRLGRKTSMTDQRGVVHEYVYDSAGRFEADKITTLPGGVDGTVRRIQRTYDNSGRVTHITSYDAATGGNVVNEIRNTYADGGANGGKWGRLTMSEQAHTGAVGGGTPAVEYAYADGASGSDAKFVRPSSVTYPGGSTRRVVYFNYPASGVGSMLSRLDNIAADANGTTRYGLYTYPGAGTIVRIEHPAVTGGLVLSYGTGGSLHRLKKPRRGTLAGTPAAR